MKEKLEQLENILNDIFKRIEIRLWKEAQSLKEFDETFENNEYGDGIEMQQNMLTLRESIVKSKEDRSFWDKDIQRLISVLESSKERVLCYRKDLAEIGGKDLPNEEIVHLLRQEILTPETPISKTHKEKEYIGHLTADGFLELEVSGVKKKLSLRKAAIFAWKTDPPNQWTFWEAPDSSGKKKHLEYFRKLLTK